MGPWVYATKVLSHNAYTFYNPHYMPFLSEEHGRIIYFEGTYTTMFSGFDDPTPRYNYNQIQYRLDLEDPRLVMPNPVYLLSPEEKPADFATKKTLPESAYAPHIAFFAPDRPFEGATHVYDSDAGLTENWVGDAKPLFYCQGEQGDTTVPLWRYEHPTEGSVHSLDQTWSEDGYILNPEPLCFVWPDPIGHPFPVGDYRAEVVGHDLCSSLACPNGVNCAWQDLPDCCIADDDCENGTCPAPGASCIAD